jgi:hypothetical protein
MLSFGIALSAGEDGHACVADGALIRALEDWCQPFAGHHLHYPS